MRGGSVYRDYSGVPANEKIIGFVHTHPYSKSERSHLGVGFSAGDISNLRSNTSEKAGFFTMVESGNKRFAAVIADPTKAAEFFSKNSKADIQKTWDGVMKDPKNSKLSFQKRVEKAFKAVVGDGTTSGLRVYATTDDKKHKFKRI